MANIRVLRLTADDAKTARRLFEMMAEVFGETRQPLSDDYLARWLSRSDLWALAAFADDELVGGLTAYTLPMTRAECSELFIYDIAIRPDHQRQGVGRMLVFMLRSAAAADGIEDVFVPADNDDSHALDFYRALGGKPLAVTHFTFGGCGD